jgi:hypothetical protein
MQKIIEEVDDLQLPESANDYIIEVSQSVSLVSLEADLV